MTTFKLSSLHLSLYAELSIFAATAPCELIGVALKNVVPKDDLEWQLTGIS
jgi:hypothetical protein